jgi:hypothetical protein
LLALADYIVKDQTISKPLPGNICD